MTGAAEAAAFLSFVVNGPIVIQRRKLTVIPSSTASIPCRFCRKPLTKLKDSLCCSVACFKAYKESLKHD